MRLSFVPNIACATWAVAAFLSTGCAARGPAKQEGADRALTMEEVMARADAAERARDQSAAARAYEHAYRLSGFDPAMLAAAAASAAQAGEDSVALAHLRRAIDEGFLRLDYIGYLERDSAFVAQRQDARWR